jgi:2-dehydropantoate 2-reductase
MRTESRPSFETTMRSIRTDKGTAGNSSHTAGISKVSDLDFSSGGERTRTADFHVANVALYQLSYTPKRGRPSKIEAATAARIVAMTSRRCRRPNERIRRVRYVIIGAGAVGGSLGACLSASGHSVVLLARGSHYEAIRDHGLRFETPDSAEVVPVPVVSDLSDAHITADDVVLLAVKSQDTDGALTALVGNAPIDTPLVCLQNGVENERVALRRFARVYGGMVIVPATYLSPGTVSVGSSPTLGICDIGAYPSGSDEITKDLVAALVASRWSSEAVPNIMRIKYGKLLENLSNALQIALGLDQRGSEVGTIVREEGVACLEAAKIDYAPSVEMRERRARSLSARPVSGQSRVGASTWQSVARGTGTVETDFLNGEISLLGRIHGIPTPANALLQAISSDVASGRRASGSMSEDEFRAELAKY